MQLSELISEVQAVVKDPAFDSKITGYINAAYTEAVTEALLPEYKRYGSVSTSAASSFITVTDTLEDFVGKVLNVFSTSIKVYDTLEEMITEEAIEVLGEIGTEVKAIATEGNILWYYPSANQIVNFTYIARPEQLEYSDDEIPFIPETIQREIAVHGASIPCFEVIEDALEGDKVNVIHHTKKFDEAKLKLKAWNGRRRTHKSTSKWG